MNDGIEVLGAVLIAHPEALLTGKFEAGVIAFAFGAQGVDGLKMNAPPVDGEAVVIGDGLLTNPFCYENSDTTTKASEATSGAFACFPSTNKYVSDTVLVASDW